MRKTTYTESAQTADTTQPPASVTPATNGLPNRLLTAFEVAEFVGRARERRATRVEQHEEENVQVG